MAKYSKMCSRSQEETSTPTGLSSPSTAKNTPPLDSSASSNLWYFAYGANMSSSVLAGQRQIKSLQHVSAVLPLYQLCFDVVGVPYSEPAFAGVRLRNTTNCRQDAYIPVHGVAHLITPRDLERIFATEGGGVAYKTVQATAVIFGLQGSDKEEQTEINVWTLAARSPSPIQRMPSTRYLALLLSGARSNNLPAHYERLLLNQATFQIQQRDRKLRIGKWLFELFWNKVQFLVQKSIIAFRNQEGVVPTWFLAIFDAVASFMWLYHDYFHARLWSRGDGL